MKNEQQRLVLQRYLDELGQGPVPKVYICSPFFGDGTRAAMIRNLAAAERYGAAAVKLGFEPRIPHIYFTRLADEQVVAERNFGLARGLEWLLECSEVWVCADESGSAGMAREIELALLLGIRVRYLFDHPLAEQEFGEEELLAVAG